VIRILDHLIPLEDILGGLDSKGVGMKGLCYLSAEIAGFGITFGQAYCLSRLKHAFAIGSQQKHLRVGMGTPFSFPVSPLRLGESVIIVSCYYFFPL
jgi:hypothetical protein